MADVSCEARSAGGERRQHVVCYATLLDDRECRLCRMHAEMAPLCRIALVEFRNPGSMERPRTRTEWTAEDDDYLLVKPGGCDAEAARHLGRTR